MRVPRRHRNRDQVEVAILEALVDRQEAGMTVFELRTEVDVNIESLEPALANLRDDDLIAVEYSDDRSLIRPTDRALPRGDEDETPGGWYAAIRRLVREAFGR